MNNRNRHERRKAAVKLRHMPSSAFARHPSSQDIVAPARLELFSPEPDTLRFLAELRGMSQDTSGSKPYHVDLSNVVYVDMSAALALTAELDRWQRLRKAVLAPVTVASWNADVRNKLFALGFFRILKTPTFGHSTSSAGPEWIQFISGEHTVGAAASLLRRKLERVFGGPTGLHMEIYASLVEAMKNTFQHAYPVDDVVQVNEGVANRRWWMAGSVNIKFRQIRIAFLDQGITIPRSLPNSWLWKKEFSELSDARMIIEAMRYGESRLRLSHRGKGFTDIRRPGLMHPANEVCVLSRGGLCVMDGQGVTVGVEVVNPFEGTLIEWYLTVPLDTDPQRNAG